MGKKNIFMDKMGLAYLEARASGKSSADACQVVRESLNKPELSDSTIRSYASKVGQHGRRHKEPKPPTEERVFLERRIRVYAVLWGKLEAEADRKNVGLSQLLNSILMQRYSKKR